MHTGFALSFTDQPAPTALFLDLCCILKMILDITGNPLTRGLPLNYKPLIFIKNISPPTNDYFNQPIFTPISN